MSVVDKNFVERFSPKKLESFILPNRIKSLFQNGLTQSMLFYGLQGSGKSSLAKYLGRQHIFMYVNASINGKIEFLRESVTEFCESYQLPLDDTVDASKKVVLFDEINGASDSFFEGLKGFMDTYPNVIFLATTNHFNKIPDPIKSRMVCVDFSFQNQEEQKLAEQGYIRRISKIVETIGMTIDSTAMQQLIEKCFPDYRKTLNLLQSISKSGVKEITTNELKSHETRFKDLYDLIITGDKPEDIHKILSSDYTQAAYEVIKSLDEEFIDYLSANHQRLLPNIPMICITVAEAMSRLSNAVDPSITLKACVFKIMTNLKA